MLIKICSTPSYVVAQAFVVLIKLRIGYDRRFENCFDPSEAAGRITPLYKFIVATVLSDIFQYGRGQPLRFVYFMGLKNHKRTYIRMSKYFYRIGVLDVIVLFVIHGPTNAANCN